MNSTLVLFNNSSAPGNFVPLNGVYPRAVALDVASGLLYVSTDNGNLLVLNGTNGTIVGNYPTGAAPPSMDGMALDATHHLLAIVDRFSSHVVIFDTLTRAKVASVSVVGSPEGVAFIPGSVLLYVVSQNYPGGNLVLLNATTGAYLGNTSLYSMPWGVVLNPSNGRLYINTGSGISIRNGSTGAFESYIPDNAGAPLQIIYDPRTRYLDIVNQYSPGLTLLDGRTDRFVANITLPDSATATWAALDSRDGRIYLGDSADRQLWWIADPTGRVVGNESFNGDGAVHDPVQQRLWVITNGLTPVDTSTGLVGPTILLGSQPHSSIYDPANGLLYVGDVYSGRVFVLKARGASGSLVATIPTGVAAWVIAYDGRNDTILVGEPFHAVVLSGATNQVVRRISWGVSWPAGAVYDPSNDRFLINDFENYFTAQINATNYADGPALQAGQGDVIYNPRNNELAFVEFDLSGIRLLNATTETQVGWISDPVGVPWELGLNTNSGEIFVADEWSPRIGVIEPNNTWAGEVRLGSNVGPYGWIGPRGMSFSPSTGNMYIADNGIGAISVVNGSALSLVTQIPVGQSPSTTVFDPAGASTAVLDEGSGSLSFLNSSIVSPPLSTPFYDAVPASTWVGHPFQFTATAVGGVPPFNYTWQMGIAGGTTYGRLVQFAYDRSGWFNVTLWINDSTGASQHTSFAVQVVAALSIALTYSPRVPDAGQPVRFTAVESGGASPYQRWWSFPDGFGSNGVSVVRSFDKPGNYTVSFRANDSQGDLVTASVSLTVMPSIWVSLSPSTLTPVAGRPISFVVASGGGQNPKSLSYLGLPPGCASANATVLNCTPSVDGSYPIHAEVTDSSGAKANASILLVVTFLLEVPSVIAGRVGQNFTIPTETTGTQGVVHFLYSGLPPGCLSSSDPNLGCRPAVTGNFSVSIRASDATGLEVTRSLTIIVASQAAVVPIQRPPVGHETIGASAYALLLAVGLGVAGGFARWIWATRHQGIRKR